MRKNLSDNVSRINWTTASKKFQHKVIVLQRETNLESTKSRLLKQLTSDWRTAQVLDSSMNVCSWTCLCQRATAAAISNTQLHVPRKVKDRKISSCFSTFGFLRTPCSMHDRVAIFDNLLNIEYRNSITFGQK